MEPGIPQEDLPKKKGLRYKIIPLGVMAFAGLVSSVSAADINWTEITSILTGVAESLFPALVTLITAAVPIIIVVTVVGFIVAFLDKILALLKMS
jgi:hypothetical protein